MESGTSNFTIKLIEDLHTYFPDLLYNSERFGNVQDVLKYIQQRTREHYNVFDRRRHEYRNNMDLSGNTVIQPAEPIVQRQAVPASAATSAAAATSASVTTPITPQPAPRYIVTDLPPVPNIRVRSTSPVLRYYGGRSQNSLLNIFGGTTRNLFDEFGSGDLLSTLLNNTLMDPVIIHPTEAQIAAATTLIDSSGISTDTVCSICQEDMEDGGPFRRINACHHIFHQSCIDTWFRQSVTCPTCRNDIRDSSTGGTS